MPCSQRPQDAHLWLNRLGVLCLTAREKVHHRTPGCKVGGCWKETAKGFGLWLGPSGEGLTTWGIILDCMLSESEAKLWFGISISYLQGKKINIRINM